MQRSRFWITLALLIHMLGASTCALQGHLSMEEGRMGFFQRSRTGLCYLGRAFIYDVTLYHWIQAPRPKAQGGELANSLSYLNAKKELNKPLARPKKYE